MRLIKASKSAISTVLLIAVGASASAIAADTPIQGNGRGANFRAQCNGYVIGLQGRSGAWIDQFNVVCGRWDTGLGRLVSAGATTVRAGLSNGGGPSQVFCPNDYVVRGIDFVDTRGDGPTPVIHHITLHCQSLLSQHQVDVRFGATGDPNDKSGVLGGGRLAFDFGASCPGAELATGVIGRSGTYVDALGLACGSPPDMRVATAPAPQPGPPPVPANTRPAPPQAIPGEPFTGTWNTFTDKNWSYRMVLVQQGRAVTGQYVAQNGDRGEISGRVGAGIMEFTWTQAGGFSGTGQFALGPDGNSFSGIYRSNPHPQLTDPRFMQGSWSGTRQ